MDTEKLMHTLCAIARKTPINEEVPPFFERRVMNRIMLKKPEPTLLHLARISWKLLIPAASLGIIIGAFFLFHTNPAPTAVDFEEEVLSLN